MAQKLILPINKARLTASWKTDAYYKRFGFIHYAIDMVSTSSSQIIYASGNGEVVAAGYDNVVGNVIAIKYPGAIHNPTGKPFDIIFRYFHLSRINVRTGTKVTKDTIIGYYGKTGILSMTNHLHLEADFDTKYPLYSPTVKNSNFIKGTAAGANSKTMLNPLECLSCKISSPDFQSYSHAGDIFIRAEDKIINKIV